MKWNEDSKNWSSMAYMWQGEYAAHCTCQCISVCMCVWVCEWQNSLHICAFQHFIYLDCTWSSRIRWCPLACAPRCFRADCCCYRAWPAPLHPSRHQRHQQSCRPSWSPCCCAYVHMLGVCVRSLDGVDMRHGVGAVDVVGGACVQIFGCAVAGGGGGGCGQREQEPCSSWSSATDCLCDPKCWGRLCNAQSNRLTRAAHTHTCTVKHDLFALYFWVVFYVFLRHVLQRQLPLFICLLKLQCVRVMTKQLGGICFVFVLQLSHIL